MASPLRTLCARHDIPVKDTYQAFAWYKPTRNPTAAMAAEYRSICRPGLFTGQAGIVTGAGSGIGRCVAHELAALGATVALVGRNAEKLGRVRQEIEDDGGSAST